MTTITPMTTTDTKTDNTRPIWRYNFSASFIELIYEFSKIHKDDNIKDYKKAWETWTNDNKDELENEIMILMRKGYCKKESELENNDLVELEKEIMKKIFQSSRYYFRKKNNDKKDKKVKENKDKDSDADKEEKDARHANKKKILDEMEKFINDSNHSIKPSDSFDLFMQNNSIDIDVDVDVDLKKIYKNKYYRIINKNKIQ
jgi:hypothetical protein